MTKRDRIPTPRPGAGSAPFFRRVYGRQHESRVTVLPPVRRLGWVVLVSAIVVAAAYFAFDETYGAWVEAGGVHKSGFFSVITHLGEASWLLLFLAAACFVCVVTLGRMHTVQDRVTWIRRLHQAWFLFTLIAFSGLLVLLLKNAIGRIRPLALGDRDVLHFEPFGGHYDFASFPSGHATSAGALLVALWLLYPRWAWVFVPVCLVVAISRMPVGAHFPSDVAGGLCFGAIFAWMHARAFARNRLLFRVGPEGRLVWRWAPQRPS